MNNQMKKMVAEWILSDPKQLDTLWEMILNQKPQQCGRAVWVLEYVCFLDKSVLVQLNDKILDFFPKITDNSARRILAKLVCESEIPEKYEADILNTAFDWFSNRSLPIAVRVNCMQIVYKICKKYPDIAPEIVTIIKNEISDAKPAFVCRGQKILKKLNKM